MRKQKLKTKYLIQSTILVFVFVFLTTAAQASEITSDNIIKYVNLARSAQGINELVANDKLTQVAKDKLDDMIANQYFAHTSPAGINPWYWFQQEGYDYHFAGENLAINFKDAEGEQSAWMASPTHRKNILDPNFQEIGVAVGTEIIDGQKSIVAVQEFGTTFAGVSVGGKKFAPLQNSNLVKDDDKIVPQVLSVKDTTPGPADAAGMKVLNQSFFAALFLVLLSIALMATAFLSVALDKIWVILEDKKAKKEAVLVA